MNKNNGLPPGWIVTKLADIGQLYCGQSPPAADVNEINKVVPYLTGPDQWDGSSLTIDKWTTAPRRIVPDGCVFVTVKGAGVGTIFRGVASTIGRDVYAYRPATQLAANFIEHALRFTIQEILREARGDIPGLSKSHILDHFIRLPPTEEQRRIVQKIEELFSKLDAGVAALERIKVALKRYRVALLKAAVEGKLTAKWRERHPVKETGSQLLRRILDERRRQWEQQQRAKYAKSGKQLPKGWQAKYKEPAGPDTSELPTLPAGWCWATPSQLAASEEHSLAIGPFGSDLKVGDYTETGVPLVFVRSIRSCVFSGPTTKYISKQKAFALRAHIVEPGDILITKMGDPPGDACLYPQGQPPAVITADCIKFRPIEWITELSFFVDAINSHTVRQQIVGITKGVAQQKVSLARFSSIALPLAPLSEQSEIVTEVDRRLSVVDEIETQIEASLKRAARLRQSILKRAFAGRLVPQDPHDEPAEQLLERIRSQRQGIAGNGEPAGKRRSPSTRRNHRPALSKRRSKG